MALVAGDRLGPYEVRAPLGSGGMGEVYRARHVRLHRDVAIKVLPAKYAADAVRLSRFEREARSASALNHPNIVTVHDIAEHAGTTYIAMELVEGTTLRKQLENGPLPVDRLVALAGQLADGVAKAHAAGIVHRDLKPENVMVTGDDLVKILDFGLAKLSGQDQSVDSDVSTATALTREGEMTGTLPYLAPEQIAGRPADQKSDQFAFGVVLYEMLCGRRPFRGESPAAVLAAIINETPEPVRTMRPETPVELERIISSCLEKDPDRRDASMAEVGRRLARIGNEQAPSRPAGAITVRRPVALALAASLLVVVAAAGWWWSRGAGERWARGEALPEIASLIDEGDVYGAYRLAREAERHIPGDERLREMVTRISLPFRVATEPAGALVEITGYSTPDGPWDVLGETPIEMRLPYALMRWRISRAGFETFEGAPFGTGPLALLSSGLPLQPEGSVPPDMVWVPGGPVGHRSIPPARVSAYWLDRFEVSNRQYQEFVDQGGYATPEYWTAPYGDPVRDRVPAAASAFVDATGRPGPSGWALGTYPEGRGDDPVGGLSWYEAAAYCAFAGKSLPTAYHWFNATRQDQLSDILNLSNFGTDGPIPVGSSQAIGDFGTFDMAGNVKEWVWNETGDRRFILGGSWNEPAYQFTNPDARNPLERLPTHGVRCARSPESVARALLDPVTTDRSVKVREPVSDEVFEAYRGLYAYDRTPLEARVEAVDDTARHWRRETVSFAAAYGGERVTALLFLPLDAEPPYQSVMWFPGDDALFPASSDSLASMYLYDFIPRSGRALVYPIYKGFYERRTPFTKTPAEWRDMMLVWYKDLARTFDYLESRDDFDAGKVAYYGFSTAFYGTVFTAIDDRFKASLLLSGGLPPMTMLPEMDPVNFAPRSRVPTLMVNGRDDFLLQLDAHQRPLFELLGAPAEDKRHAVIDGGHVPPDRHAIIREILAWLDRYLGPVKP